MAKLKVGDIFRYKSINYDFISKLIEAEDYGGETSYKHQIISVKRGWFDIGSKVHSSSEEDEHITIIPMRKGIKNLTATTPDKRKIELKIRKR